jgi:hypothetical protein
VFADGNDLANLFPHFGLFTIVAHLYSPSCCLRQHEVTSTSCWHTATAFHLLVISLSPLLDFGERLGQNSLPSQLKTFMWLSLYTVSNGPSTSCQCRVQAKICAQRPFTLAVNYLLYTIFWKYLFTLIKRTWPNKCESGQNKMSLANIKKSGWSWQPYTNTMTSLHNLALSSTKKSIRLCWSSRCELPSFSIYLLRRPSLLQLFLLISFNAYDLTRLD